MPEHAGLPLTDIPFEGSYARTWLPGVRINEFVNSMAKRADANAADEETSHRSRVSGAFHPDDHQLQPGDPER